MDGKGASERRAAGVFIWTCAVALETAAVLVAAVLLRGAVPLPASLSSHLPPTLTLGLTWIVPACLHLAAASALVLPALLPKTVAGSWYSPRSTVYGLTAALTLCLPGIGLYGCVFALGCAGLLMHHKNKTKQFRESIEAALGEDSGWISRKRVGQVLADEIAIEPVVDVLQGDDPDLKRGAVKLLKSLETPGAVKLLRQCMSDPFPEVRFYAHSALSDLEDSYTSLIKSLREIVSLAPGADVLRALGQEYRAYADSGLVDEVMRRQTLEDARAALDRSLALSPDQPGTALMLGQVLLELGMPSEARVRFEQCLQHEEVASEAQLGLAQIAYQARDFGQLVQRARSMAQSAAPRPTNPDSLQLYDFWASLGQAHHG